VERLRRVASVWSWLPAFRAVAETQHLPTASTELDVSASALSRTIRLLETDLGRALFERQGRRIVLNEAGERLLVAVRDAMRRVHDGMSLMDTKALDGPIHIASANGVTDIVLARALAALRDDAPDLVPNVRVTDETSFVPALLQGQLDVAFTSAPTAAPNLSRVHLGEVVSAVYAPVGHAALTARRKPTEGHPFVLWGQRNDGTTCDGWPGAAPRSVIAVVPQPHLAAKLALRMGALVVLPEALARPAVDRGEMEVVRTKLVQPVPVYGFHRNSLLPGGRAETLIEMAASAVAGGLK